VIPFLPDTNAFSVLFRRRDEGLLAPAGRKKRTGREARSSD